MLIFNNFQSFYFRIIAIITSMYSHPGISNYCVSFGTEDGYHISYIREVFLILFFTFLTTSYMIFCCIELIEYDIDITEEE